MAEFVQVEGVANGTDDFDRLIADYSALSGKYPLGIHLRYLGASDIKERVGGKPILTFQKIDAFTVVGTDNNDVLEGLGYGDLFYGGSGNDSLFGNGGIDHLHGGAGADELRGGEDNDHLYGGEDADRLFGDAGNDRLEGGDGNDILSGGEGNDLLFGGDGVDTLFGGNGDDYLDGGAGIDIYDAANTGGNDVYRLDAGERVTDRLGANVFYAEEAEEINGSFESILRSAYQAYDGPITFGVASNNNMLGVLNKNGIVILTFDRTIGSYDISGTSFDDEFHVGARRGLIDGRGGNDIFFGEFGAFTGGRGFDTVYADYSDKSSGYGIAFDGRRVTARDDGRTLLTITGIEEINLVGTAYDDILTGTNRGDSLDGSVGDDRLEGGRGNDRLLAVTGSDDVSGGDGDDYIYAVSAIEGATKYLEGGAGSDRFIIDVKGEVTLGFEFNTQTLGNFVNAITAPEYQGPDWGRIGVDVAFDAAGAALGLVPVAGAGLAFIPSLIKTGYRTYTGDQDLRAAVEAASAKALQSAKHYGAADWGKIVTSGQRDLVYIKDFQIGLDTLILPKLPTIKDVPGMERPDPNYFYTVTPAQGGASGVFIGISNPENPTEETIDIAFIENTLKNAQGQVNDALFEEMIRDLLSGNQIGKFSSTPFSTTNGSDTVKGWFSNDVIDAQGGRDEVFGYYGDDIIFGGNGNDVLYGGSNRDVSFPVYESTYGHDGDDFLVGGLGNDRLYGESGNDYLNGDTKNEAGVFIDTGNDLLDGGSGNDLLEGGNGDDTLYGGSGRDRLFGGRGNDTLVDTEALRVSGGLGIDTLVADYRRLAFGGAGISLGANGESAIRERSADRVILRYDGIEEFQVTGTRFDDVLQGRAGDDVLNGFRGNDELFGEAGDDLLNGGTGADAMSGGRGDDIYVLDNAADVVNEADGQGTDTVNASISYRLGAFVENLNLTGSGATVGRGNEIGNVLMGNDSDNTLMGFGGNDRLRGLGGDDVLGGGAGNDVLAGGDGQDRLNGGAGRDQFVFDSALGTGNVDTLVDFNVLADTLVLDNAVFTRFAATGPIAARHFVSGAAALDANDFLVYDDASGILSYDADGSGASAAVAFVRLVGTPELSAADFAVV